MIPRPLLLCLLLIAELTIAAVVWPQPPRIEIHWHQTCQYDAEGNGPFNPCERKFWDV